MVGIYLPNRRKAFRNTGEDPYAANITIYLKGDGTNGSTSIIDSSPTPKTVTANGNAQISTAQSKYGGSSIYLDGSGDYLSSSNNIDYIGSGSWTVESWVYLVSNSGTPLRSLCGQDSALGGWTIRTSEYNDTQKFSFRSNGDSLYQLHNTNTPTGTWTHLAVCYNGTQLRGFIDGVLTSESPKSATVTRTITSSLLIGAGVYPSGSTPNEGYANAYFDSFRITSGVVRYTGTFNPETDTYLAY